MKLLRTFSRCLPVALAILILPSLHAADYYVDFEKGNNEKDGLSPATAWKHAPGDTAATGLPAAARLAPGDTVIFKGGVSYFGSLTLNVSGAPEKPITYDGNTAGKFGTGRAILDGGAVITGWKPVPSADEVKGNPKWKQIFFADIGIDVTSNTKHDKVVVHRQQPPDVQAPWQRVMLSDGDKKILPIAQHPKPKDDFFPDLPRDFFKSPTKLELNKDANTTVLTDTERFTSSDANYFDGTMVGIHAGNNHVYFADIKSYNPDTKQITFPLHKGEIYGTTTYALYNSPRYIENPGEWTIKALGDGKSRVYILPLRLEGGQPANVAYPVQATGISIEGGTSHLRVQGFFIQRFSGGGGGINVKRGSGRSKDIAIVNNEIRFLAGHAGVGLSHVDDALVEKNMIRHCPGWTSGIFINRVTGFKIQDNFLDKNSGSGIRFYEGMNGSVSRNVVLDHYGMHSSGMNLYEGCTDVVVEENFIENVITMNRNAERIVIRNNVVDAKEQSVVTFSIWQSGQTRGKDVKDIQFLNNTFVNNSTSQNWANGLFGQVGRGVSVPSGLVVRGNIMDRPYGKLDGVFENNIYFREADAKYMGEGCQVVPVTDMKTLFMDPEKRDFRRRPGGPLPDTGAKLAPPAWLNASASASAK
ncbi:hypothetical protein DB346_09050 [Verrucomicrobia bacterium LW23]|nr:hypothetical protein DB346_09050 [Verrucomicrobia bacterium LW23]